MPKFISSAIKAYRYEVDGVPSRRRPWVTLSNADIIGTAMGFQPTALSEMYAGRSDREGPRGQAATPPRGSDARLARSTRRGR